MRNNELDAMYVCVSCYLSIRDWREAICYSLTGEDGFPVLHLPYHTQCDIGIAGVERNMLADTVVMYCDEDSPFGQFLEIPMSATLVAAYNGRRTGDV